MKVVISGKLVCTFENVVIEVANGSLEDATELWKYRDWETDRKSTRLNSSHITRSRMPSSA